MWFLESAKTLPSIPTTGARNPKQGLYKTVVTQENMYKKPNQDSVRIYTGPTYLTATVSTLLPSHHLMTVYLLFARILVPKR